MTAIKRASTSAGTTGRRAPAGLRDEELLQFVELLFFAYRDFTGEPDKILADYGLGRAHHRVLHFVNREPGLRVADLLEILTITKQSLARVLKQLVRDGWIETQSGEVDRRERLLFTTVKGKALAARLAAGQVKRIMMALEAAGPGSEVHLRRFLVGMLAKDQQGSIESRLAALAAAKDGKERI